MNSLNISGSPCTLLAERLESNCDSNRSERQEMFRNAELEIVAYVSGF